MRKLIVTTIMSLDGYVAGPGGNPMALPMDATFDAYCAERLGTADTLLLGATTYSMFHGFWPAVADNEDATEAQREISRRDNAIDKVVVSDQLANGIAGPWAESTEVVPRTSAHERIAELRAGEGGDILVFGSATLWQDLLANGLVDELHVLVGAVVLGDGIAAFPGGAEAQLQRTGVRELEGSSNVLITYAVV